MKKLIYILVFFTINLNAQFKEIETLQNYVSIKYKNKPHYIIPFNDSLKIGDSISLKIKINHTGKAPNLVGFDGIREAFGFYKTGAKEGKYKLKYWSSNYTAKSVIKDLNGNIVERQEMRFYTWYNVKVYLLKNLTVKNVHLGAWTYKDDDYQIREFKINGNEYLPRTNNKTIINQGVFKTENGKLYRLNTDKGYVTPQDFGWKSITTNNQNEWIDAEPVLDKCFNSGYLCWVDGTIYPIWSGLEVRVPTTIELSGKGLITRQGTGRESAVEFFSNNSLTKIIPMGNFDVITIRADDVTINYGNIYTGFVAHNKAAIKWDLNVGIWGGEVNGTTVQGRYTNLFTTGMGTRAFEFDTQNANVANPHLTMVNLINIRAKNCYSAIEHLFPSQDYIDQKGWINSITIINPKFTYCKKYFNFEGGSNIKVINANIQDGNVLTEAERDFPAVVFKPMNSDIEYQIYDMHNGSSVVRSGHTMYRHRIGLEKRPNYDDTVYHNRFTDPNRVNNTLIDLQKQIEDIKSKLSKPE